MQLSEHLKTKEEDRDQAWDEIFFKIISQSQLNILTEDPQQGPDGWPYLIAETQTPENIETEKSDSAQKIFHWLSTRGIGLVINPRRLPYPDYVFSYGMIWSFRETGYFIKYSQLGFDKTIEVSPENYIKTGPPSEEYLPGYVRSVLRDFFRDQSVFDPKVLMLSTDNGENYDLCFSLESLGTPPDEEHDGILEAISWFLPPHYTIGIISEKELPQFSSL